MVLVSDYIAKILGCRVSSLRDRLNHPEDREKITKLLKDRTVSTTYLDRCGFRKTFTFGGLSEKGADSTLAYGRLKRVFNCAVSVHFYARHRIKLAFPYNHCVIESFPNGHDRYYPLELLELCKEENREETNNLEDEFNTATSEGTKFPTIEETYKDDINWQRNLLSQNLYW